MPKFEPTERTFAVRKAVKRFADSCETRPTIQAVAEHCGVPMSTARRAMIAVGLLKSRKPPKPSAQQTTGDAVKFEDKGESAELNTLSPTIKTVADALAKGQVDTDKWEVDRFTLNHWEVGAKGPDNRVIVTPLWQVKVWLKRKGPHVEELVESIIARMQAHAPKYRKVRRAKPKRTARVMVEFDIMDLHFGKYAWADETGTDYDQSIARTAFHHALEDLIAKTEAHRPELVLLPLGNDMLHIDTMTNTTAKGTRQDVDSRFHQVFEKGLELLVQGIDRLRQLAPVHALVLPGNHDHMSMFHLGTAVAAWYRKCGDVAIDNSPKLRKYFQFGTTLLGFTHGSRDDPTPNNLPLLMAQEAPDMWAATTWREWHLGHYHKKKEVKHTAGDTHTGVHVRVIPSLSGTDAWHYQKGFVKNPRAAESYIWDHATGYVGHVTATVPESVYSDPKAAEARS